jgi:hypothetical protein
LLVVAASAMVMSHKDSSQNARNSSNSPAVASHLPLSHTTQTAAERRMRRGEVDPWMLRGGVGAGDVGRGDGASADARHRIFSLLSNVPLFVTFHAAVAALLISAHLADTCMCIVFLALAFGMLIAPHKQRYLSMVGPWKVTIPPKSSI